MNRRDFVRNGLGAAALAGIASPAWATFDAEGYRMEEWPRNRQFAQTPFGRIAYNECGVADVAAVFLHGFPLNSFQWRGALEQLDVYYRCIAPDFMGLGATVVGPEQDLGAASQAAMIVAFLDSLKLDRVHLVANDSGGAVAQLLAAHHPDRIRSLLLTNCDSERQSPPPAMVPVIELALKGKYADSWLAPWLADHRLARAPGQFGGECYSDPANPSDAAIEMYFRPLVATPDRRRLVEAHAISQATNALAGIGPALARSPVPTRIVWGMADTIFDPSNAEHLDRAFGNSRGLRRLERSKLFWPEELPSVIAEEGYALFRKVDA